MTFKTWHDYMVFGVHWTTFTLIGVSLDIDHVAGDTTIELALCGIHLKIGWIHNRATFEAYEERMKDNLDEMFSKLTNGGGEG